MILFDLPIYQFIMSIFPVNNTILTVMKLITTLGSTLVIVSGILSVAVISWKNKKIFLTFLSANLIGVILNNLIKIIVRRPRPTQTLVMTVENSYSFPSGHSMMSMIFYGLIIYYIMKYMKNKRLKNIFVPLLSAIIFLIGISRIYLGVHYATDVLCGWIIGLVYLIIFIKILNRKKIKQSK